MEKTLAVINELEREDLIGRYAIGGAVAAALDRAVLESIVARHGLTAKWENFRRRFLSENT